MNNKGQSLIELLVALGLLTVVITILSIATITGLQNSQYSKNQAQATKLSQEGLEKVRTIRDRNYTVCGPSPGSPQGVTTWSTIYNSAMACQSNACTYALVTVLPPPAPVTPVPLGCTATEFWLNNVNTTQPELITAEGASFSRIITIRDYGTPADITQKEVTVTVSWTDLSGTHNSKIVTVIAKL